MTTLILIFVPPGDKALNEEAIGKLSDGITAQMEISGYSVRATARIREVAFFGKSLVIDATVTKDGKEISSLNQYVDIDEK